MSCWWLQFRACDGWVQPIVHIKSGQVWTEQKFQAHRLRRDKYLTSYWLIPIICQGLLRPWLRWFSWGQVGVEFSLASTFCSGWRVQIRWDKNVSSSQIKNIRRDSSSASVCEYQYWSWASKAHSVHTHTQTHTTYTQQKYVQMKWNKASAWEHYTVDYGV